MKADKFSILKLTVIIIVGTIFVAHVVVHTMGYWSYSRVLKGKSMLFVHTKKGVSDGGSTDYVGYGFRIRKLHRMGLVQEGKREFTVGYSLKFTTPFIGPSLEESKKVLEPAPNLSE